MKIAIRHAAKKLIADHLTIAFAESATAGRIAAEFALASDAGKFLKGALVCYDACLKEDLLKVDKQLVEKFTPESAEVTNAIARGLTKLIPANIHIGVTGLPAAGGSETEQKPVGTMFICAVKDDQIWFEDRHLFSGSPEDIILQTVVRVADLLLRELSYIKQ